MKLICPTNDLLDGYGLESPTVERSCGWSKEVSIVCPEIRKSNVELPEFMPTELTIDAVWSLGVNASLISNPGQIFNDVKNNGTLDVKRERPMLEQAGNFLFGVYAESLSIPESVAKGGAALYQSSQSFLSLGCFMEPWRCDDDRDQRRIEDGYQAGRLLRDCLKRVGDSVDSKRRLSVPASDSELKW